MMTPTQIEAFIRNEKEAKQLLAAHLGKPEKVDWFYDAMKKTYKDGKIKGAAAFSFWAFFGEGFYFLYRKLYGYAISFFVLLIAAGILFPDHASTIGTAVAVTCGFSGTTAYFTKFFKDLGKAGFGTKLLQDVENEMKILGGYNTWVLYLCGFVYTVLILSVILLLRAGESFS